MGITMRLGSARTRFVLKTGAIRWGLPVGLVYSLVMAWINREEHGFAGELKIYLLVLPLWLVGGAAWGAYMWHRGYRTSSWWGRLYRQ